MIAYKFLRSGQTGAFSGFKWPEPGVWVHTDGDIASCRQGIHACRISDLPWWLADELWEIELDGQVQLDEHKIFAPAGRLRSQIEGWTRACALDYAAACAWRGHGRAVQALVRTGRTSAADELTPLTTLEDVRDVTRRLANAMSDMKIILTVVGDGAATALAGDAPASAYIAAHAAKRVDGVEGYAAERAWQSEWLVDRLALRQS
jgi:hypothetical protein